MCKCLADKRRGENQFPPQPVHQVIEEVPVFEFWETPSRFESLGYDESDVDLVLQGANDDVADWTKIQMG